jgi:16S rRNA (cytosine967-C5)-methyltransferase
LHASNPRREAFRILRRVEEAGAFASVLLESRTATLRDPRDAALLNEIVLGVLRRRAVIDHVIAAAASRPPAEIQPAVLAALRVGTHALIALDRVPDFAAVDTAVALVKESGHARAAGFANGVLRRIARERDALLPPPPVPGDAAALALWHSHPRWWTERVVARLGWERAEALLAADNQPAATVLAPWPPAGSAAKLTAALEAEGVVTEPCRHAQGALRVVQGRPQHTETFRAGSCWIQDEASQLAVGLLGALVGPTSADLCAAPGGKTLALAARTPPGGLVVAIDRQPKRLKRLAQNVSRLRADAIVALAADMSRPAPLAISFDDVFVDAPCSGTGTLRRHPEIRWRLRPEDLVSLPLRQKAILARAADLVRPGGRLVYSVCSMEPEEGADVVAAFLADRTAFARTDPRPHLSEAARGLIGDDLALRTSPADSGMDGFFAAVLTRRAH